MNEIPDNALRLWALDLNPAQLAVVRGDLGAVKQETESMPVEEIDALRLLLKHGADVNAARHDGQTALHFAAKNGSAKCVRILLDAGADPTSKNAGGDTPLAEAERYQH